MEVETSDASVDIEDFSDEIEVWAVPRFKILAIDFFDWDAACGDFRVGEPSVGLDLDDAFCQQVRECTAGIAWECVAGGCWIDARLVAECSCESFGDQGAEVGVELGFAEVGEFLIDLLKGLSRDPVDAQVGFAVGEFGGGEVARNVHRRGTRETEVCAEGVVGEVFESLAGA